MNSHKGSQRIVDLKAVSGVLGAMLFFWGMVLLIPIVIAVLYNEHEWVSFLISAITAIVCGGVMYHFFKPTIEIRNREAFLVVTLSWVLLSAFGALPFILSGVLSSYTDAFFETMSGLTTTGATIFGGIKASGVQNQDIETLPKSILFWRSLTHWVGGMGFIVLSIAILPFLGVGGVQLFNAESSAPYSDKLTPRVRDTALILWSTYVMLTFAHFVLLWMHPAMDWFDAINHAMSTLATGGFSTRDASIAGFSSVYIDVIIMIFMFLAGISFAMHVRLVRGEIRNYLNNRETRFYTLITVLSIGVVSGTLWYSGEYPLGDALRYGAFQALSIITTTGYVTDDYTMWPVFSVLFLFLLFFTGACAGSTSGGIKTFRILILLKSAFREVRQAVHPRAVLPVQVGERIIEPAMIRRILSFAILYVALFSIGALLLTSLGADFESAIGASIASLGNVGPALGQFGPTENYAHLDYTGKWVLSALMMIGRLELFTVLVLFTTAFWKE